MTNQIENGSLESETGVFASRWQEIEKITSDYLIRIKGKSRQPEGIVEKVLGLSYEELKRLTAEDCGEYSFVLAQYSYFIQQELNYHISRVKWCESTLVYITATQGSPEMISNTFGMGSISTTEYKAAKLATHNSAVKSLLQMLANARLISTTLEGLSYKIDSLSKTLINLQQSKRRV